MGIKWPTLSDTDKQLVYIFSVMFLVLACVLPSLSLILTTVIFLVGWALIVFSAHGLIVTWREFNAEERAVSLVLACLIIGVSLVLSYYSHFLALKIISCGAQIPALIVAGVNGILAAIKHYFVHAFTG